MGIKVNELLGNREVVKELFGDCFEKSFEAKPFAQCICTLKDLIENETKNTGTISITQQIYKHNRRIKNKNINSRLD